jgi:hypothetical protein
LNFYIFHHSRSLYFGINGGTNTRILGKKIEAREVKIAVHSSILSERHWHLILLQMILQWATGLAVMPLAG